MKPKYQLFYQILTKGQVKGNDETTVTVSLQSGSNVDFYGPEISLSTATGGRLMYGIRETLG